ncbi:uncharacterized protein LOC131605902 [Vicia villosa]|uniref:uncharacterized protein LOC131605902 n=1 Tax=Vicia villosa TaxID=3911 RepID=UPI00273B3162|nr:uncharacterized protein LOC131605902 [Vicia villosa]
MICIYWNIRGIANNSSRAALKNLILKNSPDFVFIAEPWMNFDNFPKAWLNRFDLKLFATNSRDNLLPNIWCLCKSHLNPVIIDSKDQYVSFTINHNDTLLGFSVVYAATNYISRRHLWASLGNTMPNTPWSFIGDFNSIVSSDEYKGHSTPSKTPIKDFFNWTDSNNLIHLPTLGNPFTWCNGRKGRLRTEKRLDRVICNLDLLDVCNSVNCNTLPKVKSDHYPLLFTINLYKVIFKSQFRFLSIWSKNEECLKIIEEVWKTKFWGCPMYFLDRKLKLLKTKLKEWNKNSFGDVTVKVKNAEVKLMNIQDDISKLGYSDSLQDDEIMAQHELEQALNIEEDFWREKSRVNWQVHGDRNTRFFHTYAKIRRRTSLINSLLINNQVVSDQNILEDHIVSHFKNLYNTDFVHQENHLINSCVPSIVNIKTNDMLSMIPNAEEIHRAVLNLKATAAPSPDGFGGTFYHNYWNVIKNDVIDAVTQFFIQDWILPNFNANSLVLIPKVKEANTIGQFRPIALANFKFKIISKIIADRLSSILPNLISNEQKGFVLGRNIRDGICLTSEAINNLNNKGFSGNVALKIDIAKAFDTLNWTFLIHTLKAFGFHDRFCKWIHLILTSATMSIGFNGSQLGYFNCSNGLRQGDPLSPLLFCIAEDVLSRGITNLVNNDKINNIKANRSHFVPSHTLFADDIMIFCRGDIKSLKAISELLLCYGSYSGQFCNNSKSLIYAGGMTLSRHSCLADIIGFTIAVPPFIYLGVPIFVGRPKVSYFNPIADNIRLKLAAWKARSLTMAGRVQLVKSVIHSMLVHCMSIYNWPGSLIKNLERWIRNFIWSGNTDQKKIVTVAWRSCCRKINEGGLGIISISAFNSATNLQLCWKFANNNQAWSQLLNARVRKNSRLIKYSIKSSIWTGIKVYYADVIENCIWSLGNGNTVNFWLDNWVGETLASKFKVTGLFHNSLVSKVRHWWNSEAWSINTNIQTAIPDLLSTISKFSISDLSPDLLAWKNYVNGALSLKEAYNFFLKPSPQPAWSSFPWDKDTSPSHSMIVWRFMHNKLPTDDNLAKRGFHYPSVCNLCFSAQDNAFHLFFECNFAKNIWSWFCDNMQFQHGINCLEDCRNVLSLSWSKQAAAVIHASLVSFFYFVWTARNRARFEDKHTHWKSCASLIAAHASLVGCCTSRYSNDSMLSFCLLKKFNIQIHPSKPLITKPIVWSPPLSDWFKCNVDGVSTGNATLAACGGIFRDHNANHILSFSVFLGPESAIIAEFMAAILCIEAAEKNNYRKLWVESDCILVVNAFKDHYLVPWKIRSRWLKCLEYTLKIDFLCTHIFREANFCADSLANFGLTCKDMQWFNYVIKDINRDFLLDKAGTPRLRLYR